MSFLYIQDLRGNPVRALWLHWYVVCIPGLCFICHSGFSHGGMGRAVESNRLGAQDLVLIMRHSTSQGQSFFRHLLLLPHPFRTTWLSSVSSFSPNLLLSPVKPQKSAEVKWWNKDKSPTFTTTSQALAYALSLLGNPSQHIPHPLCHSAWPTSTTASLH